MIIKKVFSYVVVVSGIIFMSGCTAGLTDPEIDFEPPPYVEQMPAKENNRRSNSAGSIFGQGENPLFSDHKAMYINDVVTVIISEKADSTNSGSKALGSSNEMALAGGVFSSNGESERLASAVKRANKYTDIGFNGASSSSFDGSGSASKNATFNTTISARIVKVLKNGNYFIHGKREILIDKQKQIVQISGVIRPYDITQTNEIDSSKISDAKILYETQGDIDRATQEGWFAKILKIIWPF